MPAALAFGVATGNSALDRFEYLTFSPPPTAPPDTTSGELGFDVPPGYVQQRTGSLVILSPAAASELTPCIYGIAPARAATGNLEADAEAALLQTVVPGFRRLDDRHAAMRGIAAAGWSYVWYRAAFEGEFGGERQAVNAMAMVRRPARGRCTWCGGWGASVAVYWTPPSSSSFTACVLPAGSRTGERR